MLVNIYFVRHYTPYMGMIDGTNEELVLEWIDILDRCKINEVKRYFMSMVTYCGNTQKIVEIYDTWLEKSRRGK